MADLLLGPRPEPAPVLVTLGLLAADIELARQAAAKLGEHWGEPDLWGETLPFDHTPYYEAEMGPALHRTFCTCARLMPAQRLAELKLSAWEVEQHYLEQGKRRINIDPGYLDPTKIVLASFKPGPHKLFLGHGVWADMVLFYNDGAYRPLLWTFPDLREGAHLDFFTRARRHYKQLLRQGAC